MVSASFWRFVVAAACMWPALCLAQSDSPRENINSISGLVVQASNTRPIPEAQVDLLGLTSTWTNAVLTDKAGKFEFTDVPAGTYRLTVTAQAYQPFQTRVGIDGRMGPLYLQLYKSAHSPSPVNGAVVSVTELRARGKAESAFRKGTQFLQRGNPEASIAYFEHAIARDPGYYRAYHNLGLAHYKLGQIALAEADFQKSIELTNGGYAPSQFALGIVLLEKQELRQSQRLLENGLEMEPSSAIGKYFLALAQFALNEFSEAEKSAHEALLRSAVQADAHILLARLHARDHNPYAVVNDVMAYLKLEPHGPLQNEAQALLKSARQEIDASTIISR